MSTFSVHQLFHLCPLAGLTMPVTRASTAHQAGIHRTSAGQQVPIRRAMSAQTSGLVLGNAEMTFPDFSRHFFTL